MKTKHKQTKVLHQENNKFNKPNILINVVNNKALSLKDKKVYNVLLRQLIDQNFDVFKSNTIKTSISEIADKLGIKNRNDIKESLTKLRRTELYFEHLHDGEIFDYDTNLIVGSGIKKKNKDSVIIDFSNRLTEEILKFANEYAKLDLIEMNNLKVGHSLTMYERIKSKIGSKHEIQRQNYTEEDLRKYLHLEDKYKDIRQFNQMVIKKIIEDINEHTHLDIELLKIEKIDNQRVYKFFISQDTYNINENTFRNTLRELVKKFDKPITVKYKTKTYSLEQQQDFKGNENNVYRHYWINDNTGKTVPTDTADNIWEDLFYKYKSSYFNFIEKDLGIDREDWISTERKYLK